MKIPKIVTINESAVSVIEMKSVYVTSAIGPLGVWKACKAIEPSNPDITARRVKPATLNASRIFKDYLLQDDR